MRHLFVLIVCCSLFATTQGQPTDLKGTHEFTNFSSLKQCDIFGDEEGEAIPVPNGYRFKIIRILPTGYVIQFLAFPAGISNQDDLNIVYVQTSVGNVYYLLPKDEYKRSAGKVQSRASFTAGAATSIVKIRPGSKKLLDGIYPINFDFANDFSLGILFGIKLNARKVEPLIYHNFLFGFGMSSVSVDSATTKGLTTTKTNSSALYWSFGYVFEFRKFQLGTFVGIDYLAGEAGKKWVYKNRPWIGISLGYSIFTTETPAAVAAQPQSASQPADTRLRANKRRAKITEFQKNTQVLDTIPGPKKQDQD